ncbi:hypothetical protein C8R44DRAFT_887653 [Mycena epipterygia]|nr:hypothetical protein C8R44DRAFT_887653 [Mycena epipterygia]
MADHWHNDILPSHNQVRERLHKSSGGNADYATVILIGKNIDLDKVDQENPYMMQFKPVNVLRSLVAMLPTEQYKGDWCQDLNNQVHSNHPLKYMYGTGQPQ